MSRMDAFAALIADSIDVTHTKQTPEERAAEVARSVQQLRTTVQRAKGAQQQTARIAAAEQQQAQRQKRMPAWSVNDNAAPAKPAAWTADDLSQLQSLLREEGLCACTAITRKRRKLAAAADASIGHCCCFDRLLRVSQRMQRAVADIQRRLSPSSSSTASAASSVVASSATAVAAPSADSIAASWASHSAGDDRASFLPSASDWLMGSGPVSAVAAATAAAPSSSSSPAVAAASPVWSDAQVHNLIEMVRDRRVIVLERHRAAQRRQREAKAAGAAASGDDDEEDREHKEEAAAASDADADLDLVDLPPSDWSAVAAALSSPPSLVFHPSSIRDRYFAAVDRGGLAVPSAAASHPVFYFPSQSALDKLARFHSAPHPPPRPARVNDDEEEEEASEEEREEADDLSALREEARDRQEEGEDDDGASEAGSRSAAASASRVDSVLRAVRRLSKRYRA